ncbi:MAG: Na+:solute symporter [Sedimentisphaerales bacterium]|nr:Na+:solute symporter [Sedimentisphaerales bacterium]
MQIHLIDMAIIVAYLAIIVVAGFILSKRASKDLDSYFLGDKSISWYVLGISNASSMFDITGTMLLIYWLFAYGLKSVWLPWVWPTFNQVFCMIYLSIWLRRSNVLTGAEWIQTRFGHDKGANLSHISVVIFAIVSVIGFMSYAFKGIGKFAAVFLPWDLSPNMYATIFMGITTVYVIAGGMYSVVFTDVIKYLIMTIISFLIGFIAIARVSPEALKAAIPSGWEEVSFGWTLNINWSELIPALNDKMDGDGFSLFGIFFMMVLFKGILSSMAGPLPNYDMQRILSTKSPKEAALMSWFVSVAQFIPRYFLITGITVLALVFFSSDLNAMGSEVDFEQILPYIINNFLPVGVVGLMLAGLLAAFMSTFDSTVNAGAAYLVNDIYKRYINPNGSNKTYIRASYFCTILVVVVGIAFGFMTESIGTVTMWIVAGLFGGYLAPNVLKWYWWRLNGIGYFAGMISGVTVALVLPLILPELSALNGFPFILIISGLASVLVSLYTRPENDEVLKKFYSQVRPWGFWKPIHDKVMLETPEFRKNTNFKRDMINTLVGVAWQTSLPLIAIYFVIRKYDGLCISIAVLIVTSIFLKKNWYNKLEEN